MVKPNVGGASGVGIVAVGALLAHSRWVPTSSCNPSIFLHQQYAVFPITLAVIRVTICEGLSAASPQRKLHLDVHTDGDGYSI